MRKDEINEAYVNGKPIQHDASGVGHAWRNVRELPLNIREEIEAEMIDGEQDECQDFIASNGQHYRW